MRTNILIHLSSLMILFSCVSQNPDLSVLSEASLAGQGDPTKRGSTPVSSTFIYRTNANLNSISIASVDLSDGSLVEHTSISTGDQSKPSDLVINPDHKFLYASFSGSNTISIYSINQTNGLLSLVSSNSTYQGPSKMIMHPNGKFLFTLHSDNSLISTHLINAATGELTFKTSVTMNDTGARALEIDSTGNYLFANSDSYLKVFSIDGSGELTYAGYQSSQIYTSLKTHPSTGRLYASFGMYGKILGFDVTGNGSLLTSSTSTPNRTSVYTNLVFSANGHFAYLVNGSSHTLEVYSVSTAGYLTFHQQVILPDGCQPKALEMLIDNTYLFTSCSDSSGKTLSFEVFPDGSVGEQFKTSIINNAGVSAIKAIAL